MTIVLKVKRLNEASVYGKKCNQMQKTLNDTKLECSNLQKTFDEKDRECANMAAERNAMMKNFLQSPTSPNVEAEMLTLKKRLEEKEEECSKISAAKERIQSESNTLSTKLEAKEAVCESMKAEIKEKEKMIAEADVLKQKLTSGGSD